MTGLRPRKLVSGLALVLAASTVVTTLSGCSPAGLSLDTIGQIRQIDGGTVMTVPALWAGQQTDGTDVGGIEPAEVKVLAHVDGVSDVDLTQIDSAGAGPQWRAATEQASAVATLLSARDPRDIDLGFTVSGPIDGPSAGGILTVGILASLTNTPLLRGVTMTGTISPDGSIGEVGGVPTKLKAASDAGFTTVVVPEGSFLGTDAKGNQLSLEDFQATSSLTVVPVRNVLEAFTALTGTVYAGQPISPLSPSASSESAMTAVTAGMQDRLAAALETAPAGTDPETLDLASSALSRMQDSIQRHDLPRAYGEGAFAYLRLARAAGAASARADISTRGFDTVAAELLQKTRDLRATAMTARDAAIANLPTKLEQLIDLPGALGWATFAIASCDGLVEDLRLATTDEALIDAARILGEEEVGVSNMLTDALVVLRAMPSKTDVDTVSVRGFIDGYTNLLTRAGNANVDYYTTLAGTELRADGRFSNDSMSASVAALHDTLGATTSPTTMEESVSANATAMTYFVMSNGLLSGAQSYGFTIDDADMRTSVYATILDTAVDSGAATVESFAERLRNRGYTVGAPLWSSRWGTSAAIANRSSPEAANAAWIGLNETWYDAATLFMLTALTAPQK